VTSVFLHCGSRAAWALARRGALVALLMLAGLPALAGNVSLTWDPVTTAPVVGYKIHLGTAPGSYATRIDTGNATSYTVPALTDGATYYFAVSAYNAALDESGYSNEVVRTVPSSAPVPQFTAATTSGAAPLTVNFTSGSTGTIDTHAWTFGDGTTSAAQNPSKLYSAAGTYTVSLTVSGPGGANTLTRAGYITVIAAPTPAPVAQFVAATTSGLAPLTVNFTSTSTGSISGYAWTFGDGTTSAMQNPAKIYTAAGAYTVSLTVTGPGGSNTQTRTNYVTVALAPDSGLYRKSTSGGTASRFLLDYDFDHKADAKIAYGTAGDVPLAGYIGPGGKSSLIVYRNGAWHIDTNRNGTADTVVRFGGTAGDVPLTANFSGPGALDDLVIYRAGAWYVDTGLNGVAEQTFSFGGAAGDVPLAADVDGDGIADLVIFNRGRWYVDANRDGVVDQTFTFGGVAGDLPMLFDWDGDGKADLCIFRDGVWYMSTRRDGVAQVSFRYGGRGDVPLLGRFH